MKRLFAIMMALAMMLSLGVTAFAEGEELPGSITITNATPGQAYKIYKIFDATVSADEKNIAYSIDADDEFFAELFGADGTTANDYFDYDATTGVVTRKLDADGKPLKNDAALFAYLTELVKNNDPTKSGSIETGNTLEFTGLEYGYYVITSGLGAAVTIDSTKPNAEVQDKNSKEITLTKTVDDAESNTVKVGDEVEFEVTFNAPNYLGEDKITVYNLHDALSSDWAAIDLGSITIMVDEEELVEGTDYTVTNGTATGFDINIPWVDGAGNFLYEAPSQITITYTAVVQDSAVAADPDTDDADEINKNTATLTWDNGTASDETTTKTFNMGFTKVDGDTDAPLANAEFKLYSDEACTNEILVKKISDGVYTVTTGTTGDTIVTSATANGQVVIMGLDVGTTEAPIKYWLKETKAPDGYNLMADPTVVELDTTPIQFKATDYQVNDEETIENNKGVELPSTGGEGTMKMITIGTIIAIGFAVLLITNKKMTIYQD